VDLATRVIVLFLYVSQFQVQLSVRVELGVMVLGFSQLTAGSVDRPFIHVPLSSRRSTLVRLTFAGLSGLFVMLSKNQNGLEALKNGESSSSTAGGLALTEAPEPSLGITIIFSSSPV